MEIAEPVTVRCSALVLRDESVLLCRRRRSGVWVLPGGSPRRDEGASDCARREVRQETGLVVTPRGIAFVMEATSPKGEQHLFEIVFGATEEDTSAAPRDMEPQLSPCFVELGALGELKMLPPIAEHLMAFAAPSVGQPDRMATYLGNVWTPGSDACAP